MEWFRPHLKSVESIIPGVRLSFHEFSLCSPVSTRVWSLKVATRNSGRDAGSESENNRQEKKSCAVTKPSESLDCGRGPRNPSNQPSTKNAQASEEIVGVIACKLSVTIRWDFNTPNQPPRGQRRQQAQFSKKV